MRCKACDNVMTEREIIWDEGLGQHEEFCSSCKAKMYDSLQPEYVNILDLDGDLDEIPEAE